MNPNNYLNLHTLILCIIVFTKSYALPEDRSKAIVMVAEFGITVDLQKGIAEYKGNAKFSQGTTQLTGDLIRITTNNSEVVTIFAQGTHKPACFEEKHPKDKGLLKASAQVIEYSIHTGLVKLIDGAQVVFQSHQVSGNEIHYDYNNQVIYANGDSSSQKSNLKSKAVNIMIKPKTLKQHKVTPKANTKKSI